MSATLERVTFSTPRDSGYAKVETLEKLAGCPKDDFGHVILKELADNGLDAAEDAGIAPEITVSVTPGSDGTVLLTVEDNGPGMDKDAVASICDFTRSTSSRAAYVGPSRGAQGNAWPLIISMPHALGVRPGTVVIEGQGIRHEITPELVLGQRLTINRVPEACGRAIGTRVIVPLPASLDLDARRWVQDYAAVNPHAEFSVCASETDQAAEPEIYKSAGQDTWRKWMPSKPTSPHWYDEDRLRDLISSYLAAGDDKPLGKFVREFDGLTGTGKAAQATSRLPRVHHLSDFRAEPDAVHLLLTAMRAFSRQVKPAALGKVPEEHYRAMMDRLFGISRGRFWYARKEAMHGGVPWAVDVVVTATDRPGRVIYATNFGVSFDDPLANADLLPDIWNAATGAASFLRQAGAYPAADNGYLRAALVHVQCAAPRWTDTGKVRLIVPEGVRGEFAAAFARATKTLRDERERARKDAAKEARRQEREERTYWEQREREEREPPLKGVVRDLLTQAGDLGEVTVRDLYGMAADAAAEVTSRELTFSNFRQILAGFERDFGQIPGLDRDSTPGIQVDLSRHPRGPEELKAAAAMLGLGSYADLLALSRDNDPYAMGKPAEQNKARWFADLAGRVMSGLSKLHVRGFHYRWFTAGGQGLDGRRYENDQEHWQEIARAAKIARVLGLVDPEAFEDRRNKAGLIINSAPRDDSGPDVTLGDGGTGEWALPQLDLDAGALPPLKLPEPFVTGYGYTAADQPEVLVLVTEKMDDVLAPACQELAVDLMPGAGYTSYTRAIQLLRHAEARNQPVHVFYVSDYDAAGENMPIAVARACQYFAEQLGIKAEITLEPLALTAEQVERYGLPKAPDKKQTELDALEALHPGELAQLLRAAVGARRDATLAGRLEAAGRQAQEAAEQTWRTATADLRGGVRRVRKSARKALRRYQAIERRKATEISAATAELRAQIAAIETEITSRYAPAKATAMDAIDARNAELAAIAAAVRQRWESTEFGLPDRPEPEVDVDDSGLLYDSRRHWLDQLAAYKAAKAATSDEPDGERDLGGAA